MSKVELIKKEIDEILLEKEKNYMSLGQANKLLFENGLITEVQKKDQYLKKLLESGKIENAIRTEKSPRQWRIFLSDKSLNKKENKTEKKSLTKNHPNSINKNSNNLSKNKIDFKNYDWKKISYGVLILIFVFVIVLESNDDSYDSNSILAYNYAKDYVKEKLKAPSTAKFPDTFEKKDHVNNLGNGRYLIKSWVESQNSLGALIRSRWSCKIIFKDDQVLAKNLRIQ